MAHKTGQLDKPLDADGDGMVSQEEWEAEWASRGDLATSVTRETTPYQLAVNYPGATIKNMIGPQDPHVKNTPFTAYKLPADPAPNPNSSIVGGVDNAGKIWGKVHYLRMRTHFGFNNFAPGRTCTELRRMHIAQHAHCAACTLRSMHTRTSTCDARCPRLSLSSPSLRLLCGCSAAADDPLPCVCWCWTQPPKVELSAAEAFEAQCAGRK